MPTQKSDVVLQVKGRPANAYLVTPAGSGKKSPPGVLVLHAWWGLKPFFKQVCDALGEQGFLALAPDLYQGRIAGTIDEAKALLEQRDLEFMAATVATAREVLLTRTERPGIGAIGFSMGCSYAMDSAVETPDRISAVVLFYGAVAADFSQVRASVLGHFGEADEWEPLESVRGMEADMRSAGVDLTLHVYPGAAHWFVESDRPEHDGPAAEQAWKRTYSFLKRHV
jgi:carboxymethylenebutenolidase